MDLLLDTHTFVWWSIGDEQLSDIAKTVIADPLNRKFVSALSAWEIVTKFNKGKTPLFAPFAREMANAIIIQGFEELMVTVAHAELGAKLPLHHKDPIDRMLIAQAMLEKMQLVSCDDMIDRYATIRLW